MRAGGVALALALACGGCTSPTAREVRTLMQSPIAPASDAIFNAVIYTNGQLVASPRSDTEWNLLLHHADSLAAAALRIAQLAPSTDPAPWTQSARAMADASASVQGAVTKRDLAGVLDAGSRLYETCTTCHAVYVKD